MNQVFFYPLIVAAGAALLFTPIVIRVAKKHGLIDDPKKNKQIKVIHTYPVPRGGGLAIYLAITLASLIFLPFDRHLIGILTGGGILVLIGLIDDKFNLNPYLRLLFQLMAAGAPIAAGIGIAFINLPFFGIVDLSGPKISFEFLGEIRNIWILSDLFALFWLILLMNILNMGAKGIDGQLTGVVIIAALVIAVLSLRFSADITQWPIIILAGILAGAFLGFLPYHLYPQKIMPAFSGSTLAGFMLGVLSILSTAKVGLLMVTLAVPFIDTGYTIIRRLLSGHSPVWGDRGHLHHRLYDSGWSKQRVAFFYWVVTGAFGLLALNLNSSQKAYTIIGTIIFIGGLLLFLTRRPKK